MRIKTNIGYTGEWQVNVKTTMFIAADKHHISCYLSNYRGESITLISRYILDEKIAFNFHQELCQKAKGLFDL
jgi:hypothetical protein